MVRKGHSVRKKASWGTRRIFRGPPCSKQASGVQKGYSVPETAFSGTRRIFSARNGLREEASKHKKRVLIKVYQDFLEYTLLFEPQNYWSAWQDSSGKSPPLTAKKGICAFWLCGIRYRTGWRSASGSPPPQNLSSRSPLD